MGAILREEAYYFSANFYTGKITTSMIRHKNFKITKEIDCDSYKRQQFRLKDFGTNHQYELTHIPSLFDCKQKNLMLLVA